MISDITSQTKRWDKLVKKWKVANQKNKVMTMGYININSLSLSLDPASGTHYDRSLNKIVETLHKYILNKNTSSNFSIGDRIKGA